MGQAVYKSCVRPVSGTGYVQELCKACQWDRLCTRAVYGLPMGQDVYGMPVEHDVYGLPVGQAVRESCVEPASGTGCA